MSVGQPGGGVLHREVAVAEQQVGEERTLCRDQAEQAEPGGGVVAFRGDRQRRVGDQGVSHAPPPEKHGCGAAKTSPRARRRR